MNAQAVAVRSAVDAATRDAKGTTLFKDVSGALRSSIGGTSFGARGQLRVTARHARWIENGTRAHDIVAKGGGTLAFMQNGAMRFAKRVHHPGTAERPFMLHARDVGEQTLEYGLDYFVGAAIAHFNG